MIPICEEFYWNCEIMYTQKLSKNNQNSMNLQTSNLRQCNNMWISCGICHVNFIQFIFTWNSYKTVWISHAAFFTCVMHNKTHPPSFLPAERRGWWSGMPLCGTWPSAILWAALDSCLGSGNEITSFKNKALRCGSSVEIQDGLNWQQKAKLDISRTSYMYMFRKKQKNPLKSGTNIQN